MEECRSFDFILADQGNGKKKDSCFLKAGGSVKNITPNPKVNHYQRKAEKFTEYLNQTIYDGDFKHIQDSTLDACTKACLGLKECTSYDFFVDWPNPPEEEKRCLACNKARKHSCFLKGRDMKATVDQITPAANVVHYRKKVEKFSEYLDQTLPGADIQVIQNSTPNDCAKACLDLPECKSYDFVVDGQFNGPQKSSC